ncbi:cobalt/nickel transport system permease protein [Nocardioides daedukensis]|uniref:Cobalt/nickel transport system permease protein n=1 Tax=Nocardioides daedukensis TaxID=634462 RepID=A0A7Y9RZT2_9ACTN|nr:cobalt ECF transporter T component CbiQ [Nocardioides daedukensis]NYG58339.1 cobalt/nickel transport system permease protein [Nocardioides daedukensis]
MAAGHDGRLLGNGPDAHHHSTPVHRVPAHLKVLVLVGFMLVVVATPHQWWPLYVVWLAVVLGVIATARIRPLWMLSRMLIEVPFVLFAVLMPFIATGERIDVLGVSVSQPGLVAGATFLVKATLGVMASLSLAATTDPVDLLRGLRRLHMPEQLVSIMGFMIRYLDVITGELSRMVVGMRSRGCDPKSPRHWPTLARTLGALFIRSYERGERMHLAMLSRGYTGRMPEL